MAPTLSMTSPSSAHRDLAMNRLPLYPRMSSKNCNPPRAMTFVTNWPKIVVQLIVLGAVMLNPNALVTIVKNYEMPRTMFGRAGRGAKCGGE